MGAGDSAGFLAGGSVWLSKCGLSRKPEATCGVDLPSLGGLCPSKDTLACPRVWHDLHLSLKLHIPAKLAQTHAWGPPGLLPQEMVLLSLFRRVGMQLPAQRRGPGP